MGATRNAKVIREQGHGEGGVTGQEGTQAWGEAHGRGHTGGTWPGSGVAQEEWGVDEEGGQGRA